jgi:hypothetical protein
MEMADMKVCVRWPYRVALPVFDAPEDILDLVAQP